MIESCATHSAPTAIPIAAFVQVTCHRNHKADSIGLDRTPDNTLVFHRNLVFG